MLITELPFEIQQLIVEQMFTPRAPITAPSIFHLADPVNQSLTRGQGRALVALRLAHRSLRDACQQPYLHHIERAYVLLSDYHQFTKDQSSATPEQLYESAFKTSHQPPHQDSCIMRLIEQARGAQHLSKQRVSAQRSMRALSEDQLQIIGRAINQLNNVTQRLALAPNDAQRQTIDCLIRVAADPHHTFNSSAKSALHDYRDLCPTNHYRREDADKYKQWHCNVYAFKPRGSQAALFETGSLV